MTGNELSSRLGFSAGRLDRMAERRTDVAFITAEQAHDDRRVIVFSGDAPLVTPSAQPSCLFEPEMAQALGEAMDEIYLGRLDGIPVFAHRIELEPNTGESFAGQVADLRGLAVEAALDSGHVAVLGLAKSLLSWHRRHGFCAN